jgi:hypothetical protein
VVEQRGAVLLLQIGNSAEIVGGRLREPRRRGVAAQKFENPTGGEVMDDERQFGKGQGRQMVELIDEPSTLANDGLKPTGDLAKRAKFEAERPVTGRPFGQREAGGGAGLDGIGLPWAEQGGTVVLVAVRVAARNRDDEGWRLIGTHWLVQGVHEVEQVVSVLTSGVETDDEVDGAVVLGDTIEPLPELAIPLSRFDELKLVGSRLKILPQEGGIVTIA